MWRSRRTFKPVQYLSSFMYSCTQVHNKKGTSTAVGRVYTQLMAFSTIPQHGQFLEMGVSTFDVDISIIREWYRQNVSIFRLLLKIAVSDVTSIPIAIFWDHKSGLFTWKPTETSDMHAYSNIHSQTHVLVRNLVYKYGSAVFIDILLNLVLQPYLVLSS